MSIKTRIPKAAQLLRTIPKELMDQFVNGPMSAEAANAVLYWYANWQSSATSQNPYAFAH